jgi:hypothetical protein
MDTAESPILSEMLLPQNSVELPFSELSRLRLENEQLKAQARNDQLGSPKALRLFGDDPKLLPKLYSLQIQITFSCASALCKASFLVIPSHILSSCSLCVCVYMHGSLLIILGAGRFDTTCRHVWIFMEVHRISTGTAVSNLAAEVFCVKTVDSTIPQNRNGLRHGSR